MSIAILILAAGSASRMGVAKQLLAVGETTLLGITIENALKSNAQKVYCILGAKAEAIKKSISRYSIECIINANYKSGLSSSIVTGIEHLINQNHDAVLILLGDQPLISAKYLNEMIDIYKKHDQKIVASIYNSSFGVPTIVPRTYYNQLLKLKGDKGAKVYLNTKKDNIISLENMNLMDIDTKEDYQELLNSINSE